MSLRILRGLGVLLAALVLLTLLGAWLVPPMLDWNRYRDTVADIASEILGRPVRIEGPVTLSLLPQPILTAATITVADAQEGVTINLAELRLRLALGPLLSGRVDAQELVMRGLDVKAPWPFATDSQAEPIFALRAPSWLSSVSARIEDGKLTIGNFSVTGIDATLGTQADTGSYAVAGQAQISGLAWHMTARLTQPGGDGSAGLDFSLDGQGPVQGMGAMFSGQINADGTLNGHISGRGPDLSRLLPAPKVPFRADGRLSVAAGLAVADQLAIDLAGSPARGAVSLRLKPAPRLDISLAASRLDLDTWLPTLLQGATSGTIAGRISTGIDLSAEAATLAGGTLRALRGRFDLAPDHVILHDITTTLPGDAQLRLEGEASRKPGDSVLHFVGPATIAAPNFRTTLAWLEGIGLGQIAELPPGVLRTAVLKADVTADTGAAPRIQLANLTGTLDGATVQGLLAFQPGARLALTGALSLDRLDLDPWLPAEEPALASLPGQFDQLGLDLRLAAALVRVRGRELTRASLDVATEPGRLVLRQFDANSLGVHVAALGSLQQGGRIANARLELQASADQAAPALAAWIPELAPLTARLPRGAATLTITGAGALESLGLHASADLGDLHIEAQPVLDLPTGSWTGQVTLRHPGAPRLLDSIGMPGTAAWLGDGSLSLVANVTGTAGKLVVDSFDLSAGSLRAGGSLTLDRSSDPIPLPRLTGRISAETLPLPLPYPRAPDPLPTELLAGWQASLKLEAAHVLAGMSPILERGSAQLTIANQAIKLDAITGTVENGALTGAIALNAAPDSPTFNADLALAGATVSGAVFDLPLDITSGVLTASTSLTANGHSPQALLSTLSGSVNLAVSHGTLTGVSLDRIGSKLEDDDLRAALAGGSTGFDALTLTGALQNGALTVTKSSLTTKTATGILSGLIDIAGRTSELRLAVHPDVDQSPEIAVRLSGPLNTPTRTPEIANATTWRALHP